MDERVLKALKGIRSRFFYRAASCAASFAASNLHWIAKILQASSEKTKMVFEAMVEAFGGKIMQNI